MKKILCIAVHADDETLGCGGTLLKHKDEGDEIYWLIITSPSNDERAYYSIESIERRKRQVKTISNKYGFKDCITLDNPASLLHCVDLKELISQIDGVFQKIKPNVIYTMFANDVHSDHRVAFEAVYSCTKSFRYPFIERIYMMETISETEFAMTVPAKTFLPNVYVDISKYIDLKLEIMAMYTKQIMQEPYPRSLSSIKALARTRGSRAGVMYAEAFQLLYERR